MRLRELFADKNRDPQTHERYYSYNRSRYEVGVQVLERMSRIHPNIEVSIKATTGSVAVIEKRSTEFESREGVAEWIGEQLDEIDELLDERDSDDALFAETLFETVKPDESGRSKRPSDQADDDAGDADE